MSQFSNITYVDVKLTRTVKMGNLPVLVEETKRFYFETDNEGLKFSEIANKFGGKVTGYGSLQTTSVNAAHAGLQSMYDCMKI
jgi:hypothetical protein